MTPTHRPSRPRRSTSRLPARTLTAGTLLGTLAVTGTALALHRTETAAVTSAAVAAPSALPAAVLPARPVEPTRASRTRALPAKALPMKTVTRTVATGPTFSGAASWYGGSFQGRRTANGERFDTSDLTAASKTLPFGTRLRVCRLERCVVVRVNDRGPYVGDRVLDLSRAAAQALGYSGVAHVTATPVGLREVQVVDEQAVAAQRAAAVRRHQVAVRRAQVRAARARREAARQAQLRTAQVVADEHDTSTWPLAAVAAGLAVSAGGGLWRARRHS